ncbi:hypothetical protein JR316_0005059 [Psilocybe cubensis]|uniref:HBS1-like protein N-terminal domain-containing protein n=2 Tax=Psilocybe cubensis TaxID=181762 RepID=A0A8H7Y1N8_PSICU|nr:hypothetical protein JR316_0005059 [Psilocybe cubensis]KAH9482959.1 hypothetical protein JR316_0005059 [Psilocybe cubensis]
MPRIADELEDDALSDGGDYDMTPDQQGLHDTNMLASVQAELDQARMEDGLDQVKLVIGDESQSGFSDNEIRDVLWEYYFDIEKTIEWALEERQRRQQAKERKGDWGDHVNDPSTDNIGGSYQYYQDSHSGNFQILDSEQGMHETETRPRLPSIFLAQQQPGFDNQAYLAVASSPASTRPHRLSTITERTERTEPSMLWRSVQPSVVPTTPRSFVSSNTTSYGKELDREGSLEDHHYLQDPNTSRTSPSGSAIQRLSIYDPPPSNSSTISPPDPLNPPTSSDQISLKDIPSIPDLTSKSSEHIQVQPPTPSQSLPSTTGKAQSKLSKLASSRASTISSRSESSRSSGTSVMGSIKTYPALRPSALSERPPSSVASSKELPPLPSHISSSSDSSIHDSTSSIVRRAIQTAIKLEAVDKEHTPRASRPQSPVADGDSTRSKTPTPRDSNPAAASSLLKTSSPSARPLSKLALLAQKKSETASSKSFPYDNTSASSPSRPLSKLAMLAQQTVDASRVPKLPKTTTEYLTPIANGSSVTTAITTSYQSLYSLTDPSKSNVIPKLDIVPIQSPISVVGSPSDIKPSKLALKIKRAGEKTPINSGFPSEDDGAPPISPIFLPGTTRARASPSAFASVLIHDESNSKDRGKDKEARRKNKDKERHGKPPKTSPKHASQTASQTSKVFAFDGPSPDDIVFNARKKATPGSKKASTLSTPKVSEAITKS